MEPSPVVSKKQQVPWATLGLITLNLLTALAGTLDPELVAGLSFDPARPSLPTALASLFLHANLIHLLGNMVFLAAVGPKVEAVAGRLAYLTVYFGGGFAGTLAHWAIMKAIGGSAPLLGASGAIAGCAGYCAVRFMGRKVPLAPRVHVTVGAVTLLWVGIQALGAFVRFGGQLPGGPAFWTHLAGFGAGLLLSIVFKAPQQASLQQGHEVMQEMSGRGPAALLQAAERHLEQHPTDQRALREMATALHQMGERDKETDVLLRLLAAVAPASQPSVLEDLRANGAWGRLSGIERLRLAEAHRTGQPELAKRLARSVAEDPGCEAQQADALLALVQMTEGEDREPYLEQLQTKHALHAATEIARQKGLIR
ncbi:MAG: rhomboid family intramembrane serine protease [Armatimonadetes bacterium]|nr:rhomboid family intramembrane serine protease [Armatimonadota bacterium]